MNARNLNAVWYVSGVNDSAGRPVPCESEYAAEILARRKFPKEDAHTRYARVYHQQLLTEDEARVY